MKWHLKQIAAAGAVFALAGSAHAVVITQGNLSCCSLILSPLAGSQLSFGSDMLGAFDTVGASIASTGASSVAAARDSDGFYISASVSSVITSATFDDASGALQGWTSTGGATYVVPAHNKVSSGGSLTLTDLSVDLASHQIYADIIGANGVGTLTHVQLLNFINATGSGGLAPCPLDGYCSLPPIQLSGLTFTAQGFNVFSQALGVTSLLGAAALAGVNDVGVIMTSTLPEPSTYALMGLGLVGMMATQRRRRHHLNAQ